MNNSVHELATIDGVAIVRHEYDRTNVDLAKTYVFSRRTPGRTDATLLGKVRFQEGPIKSAGYNGLTESGLIAVLMDRLRGHQRGEHACEHNAMALAALANAQAALESRTASRVARGVEGTSKR